MNDVDQRETISADDVAGSGLFLIAAVDATKNSNTIRFRRSSAVSYSRRGLTATTGGPSGSFCA
jgi:hypothetical protein